MSHPLVNINKSDININSEALRLFNDLSWRMVKDVRDDQKSNFVFSPLSSFLSISSVFALSNNVDYSSLGFANRDDLISFCGDLEKMITTDDGKKSDGYNSLVKTANIVIDNDYAFDESQIEMITSELYSSYLRIDDDFEANVKRWIEDLSNGAIKDNPGLNNQGNKISFVNGMYIDLPFDISFVKTREQMPFNNELIDFMQGKAYGANIYDKNDYEAIQFSFRNNEYKLQFLKPKQTSLASFFSNHHFEDCFDSSIAINVDSYINMPYNLQIDSSINLASVIKNEKIASQNITFGSNDTPYDIEEMKQNNSYVFSEYALRGYSLSQTVMIPESDPQHTFTLDSSFAFRVVAPNNITLLYGEITD